MKPTFDLVDRPILWSCLLTAGCDKISYSFIGTAEDECVSAQLLSEVITTGGVRQVCSRSLFYFEMIMEITLSSCENSYIDICSNRRPYDDVELLKNRTSSGLFAIVRTTDEVVFWYSRSGVDLS